MHDSSLTRARAPCVPPQSMAKTGTPSRGEVTDAAFAGRAEAVMLNKGPFMPEVLALLRDVMSRMQTHGAQSAAAAGTRCVVACIARGA